MRLRYYITICTAAVAMCVCATSCSSGSGKSSDDSTKPEQKAPGGPQLGQPGRGPVYDKSGDSTLQAMIKEIVPKFRQLKYKDERTGKIMHYNLYTPEVLEKGKKYPLVLFIADASTPGPDVKTPLTQGYGALVWATSASQKKNPCYVLVPQFEGVGVNDAYQHSTEAEIAMRLLKTVAADNQVDQKRLYATGQSMGGMISMYYNVAYPEVFAASIFVDSHWNQDQLDELAQHKFVWFLSGNKSKAYKELEPMENACRKDSVQFTFAEWSARLPESTQSETAAVMLEKGAPVNIFMFEPGTVLPSDGQGSEHVYSFDYAFKVQSVRDWLFTQSK